MAQVLYASPAWWGYTRAKDQEKLERLVGRLKRQGFLSKEDMDISELANKADQKLFQAIRNNPHHVLYSRGAQPFLAKGQCTFLVHSRAAGKIIILTLASDVPKLENKICQNLLYTLVVKLTLSIHELSQN